MMPSKEDYVVARTVATLVKGGQKVIWIVLRNGYVAAGGFKPIKAPAVAMAKRLAKVAGVRYWIERASGGYDGPFPA
jgi:hypothetical protein